MKKCLVITALLWSVLSIGQPVYDWVPVATTPGDMVYSLTEYQNQLVAAGIFTKVGTSNMNRIASWNGSTWTSLGNGVRGSNTVFGTFIYDTKIINGELYVWGDFDSAGTIKALDIAKWNGSTWSTIGNGSDLSIYCLTQYKGKLYAGGTFKHMGTTSTNYVAVYNGSLWQPVGNNSLRGGIVNDLFEYQNELYAVGLIDSVNGSSCNFIAKWNDTVWSKVGNGMDWFNPVQGGAINQPNFVLTDWNNKMLVASTSTDASIPSSTEIYQWDGVNWSLFSSSYDMGKVRRFYKYNGDLLCSGGVSAITIDQSNVWKWNGSANSWSRVGHGVNKSVRALGTYNGELYCGGNFNTNEAGYFNYMAKLGVVTNIEKIQSVLSETKVYPNPINEKIYLQPQFIGLVDEFRLKDITGQTIFFDLDFPKNGLNCTTLKAGFYILQLKIKDSTTAIKIIKN